MPSARTPTIEEAEELFLGTWLARERVDMNGWAVRMDAGYTKRANSVTPRGPGGHPLEESIIRCEQLFRERGLTPVFRLSPLAPPELGLLLARRGYVRDSLTHVMQFELSDSVSPPTKGKLLMRDLSSWIASYSQKQDADIPRALVEILARMPSERGFAELVSDSQSVGCGIVAIQHNLAALYDIVVSARERRKGWGRCLLSDLLSWAQDRGATNALLQVEAGNAPALALYERRGFRHLYDYSYCVAPMA